MNDTSKAAYYQQLIGTAATRWQTTSVRALAQRCTQT
jgi:hypothetical protein